MDDMKKLILMILPALLLAGCEVKDQETEITVFQTPVQAIYTGKVKGKVPNGEGTALMENDAKAEGKFEKGTFVSGEATDVPYHITFNEQPFTGSYTGLVADQLPSGTGTFHAEDFSFEGTWINGAPQGQGTVSAKQFGIDTAAGRLEGSYSGEAVSGAAEGTGTFIYQSDGNEITMEGTFSGNQFDGILTRSVRYKDTVKSYPVCYENGTPQDSAASMIAYLEGMREKSYCLNEAQLSFLTANAALFEGTESAEASDDAFDYAAFSESDSPAVIRIRNASVKSVQRYKPYSGAPAVTTMIVQNSDGWYHLVFPRSIDSVSSGDTVDIYALPLCRSTLSAPEQEYEAIDAAGVQVIGGSLSTDTE